MNERESTPSLPPAPYLGMRTRPAFVRLARALVFGTLVGIGLTPFVHAGVAAIAGWDAGGLYLLGSAWWIIARATPQDTRARAAAEDPGRGPLFALVLVASSFSIFANAVVLKQAQRLPVEQQGLMVGLCLSAAAIAWLLTHTTYSLRYAHLYYRTGGRECGGLEFPGGHEPCDLDFVYFAFTIGMCFQVSDVVISSRTIRRASLGQALLSFAFNTIVFALALNIVFALIQ